MAFKKACIIGSTQLAIDCTILIHTKGIAIENVFTDDVAFESWAKKKSISTSSARQFLKNSNEFFSRFDFLFSIVNDIIVPHNILEAIASNGGRSINYHNGPLPRYRGVNATQWAIINGEKEHGVTWHLMEDEVDVGSILAQEFFSITDKDDLFTVTLQCREAALRSLDHLCTSLVSSKLFYKFESKPSAFCMLPFHKSATDIWNFFRSTSTLGKVSQVNSLGLPKICLPASQEPIIVKSLDIDSVSSGASPGTVLQVEEHNIRVGTKDKDVIISDLVRMDGTDIQSPFNDVFLELLGSSIHLSSAHDKSSPLFLASKLAGKQEWKWVKKQSRTNLEPALSWPYMTYHMAVDDEVEGNDSLSYVTVALQTFDDHLLAKLTEIMSEKHSELSPESSPEITILAAFMAYMLLMSPTLSGSLDAYCNNLPNEHTRFLLRALPVSLSLAPQDSFQDSLSLIYKSLKMVIHGQLKGGVRQDLVCADVYLRHPGVLTEPRNTFAVSAVEAGKCFEFTNPKHEVVILSQYQPGNHTVFLEAKARHSSCHKYSFDKVASDFNAFLCSPLEDPLTNLESLPLCTSECLAQIQPVLTGKSIEISVSAVHDPIEDQAKHFPHVIAVVDEFSSHTYSDMMKRSNEIACSLLQQFGTGKGLFVALLLDRTWEAIAAMLGVLKIGACFALLEPNHPPKVLASILQNSGAKAVLVDNVGAKHLESIAKELNAEDIKMVPQVLTIKAIYMGSIPEVKQELHSFTPSPNDPAVIISTSGTTGVPKAVIMKHSGLCNYMSNLISTFELKPTQIVNGMVEVGEYSLAHTSFNFDGSLHETFPILWVGGTLIIHPTNPAQKSRCKAFTPFTTFLFSQPTKLSIFTADAFCSVRNLSIGGEPFALQLLKPWHAPNRKIWNVYGPCETTVGCTLGRLDNTPIVHLGRPIANAFLQVLSASRQPLPLGVPGELHVGGAGVSLGYIDLQLNEEAFWEDRSGKKWYSTRDLVLLDNDLSLHFLNRVPKDRQAKIHGIRVELFGIENVLRQIPSVQFAHVQVENVSAKTERLVAVVAPENVDIHKIKQVLKKELPSYLIPSLIIPLHFSSIHFTRSGKVDTSKILKSLNMSATPFISPTTNLEEKVLKEYSKELDAKEGHFGMKSSFIEFGGDSLSVMKLASSLSSLLRFEVTPNDIVETQTPEKLLQNVEGKLSPIPSLSPIMSTNKQKKRTVSFFQDALASMNSQAVGPTYNTAYVLKVSGSVNGLRLASVIEKVLQLLSAAYKVDDSHDAQTSGKATDIQHHVCHIDLSSLSPKQALLTAQRETQLDAVTPINFSSCPYRCNLYYLGNGNYLISVIAHHLVFDHQTWKNFGRTLGKVYSNSTCSLSHRDFVPYSEFVSYEQEKSYQMKSKSEKFWKKLSKECTSFIDFPTCFPRESPVKYYGNVLNVRLPEELCTKLHELLSFELTGVRPVSFFLAMYGLLISKVSNRHSFAVGVSTSLRSSPKMEKIFGMVLSVIPCVFPRERLEQDSLISFIKYISNWFWTSLDYVHFPFFELVKIWGGDSKYSHVPQFLYNYASEPQPQNVQLTSDVVAEKVVVNTFTAKAEISLDIQMSDGGYVFFLEYSTTLFSKSAMERIAQEYINLISISLEDIHSPTASLQRPLIPDLQYYPEPKVIDSHSKYDSGTKHALTEHQMALYRECVRGSIDQCSQWHSTFSIKVSPMTKAEDVLEVLHDFPYLSSYVSAEGEEDIHLVECDRVRLQLHSEGVSNSEEATGVKYRLWTWPIDIFKGPLFRCVILNHTDSKQVEIFCVSHQLLLDEASLYVLSGKLLEILQGESVVPSDIGSSILESLMDYNSTEPKAVQSLYSLFSCLNPLPPLGTNHIPAPSQCLNPTSITQKVEAQSLTAGNFVAFSCMFSSILLTQLQGGSHTHFALLIASSLYSLTSNENIVPVCVDVDANDTLHNLLAQIQSFVTRVYSASVDKSYSYWTSQEMVNPLNSYTNPFHEVLVKVFPYSVPIEYEAINCPRPFTLCLSFSYHSQEVTMTSSLSFLQTELTQKCFVNLLSTLGSADLMTSLVSSVTSPASFPLSICVQDKHFSDQLLSETLSTIVSSAFEKHQFENAIAVCEASQFTTGKTTKIASNSTQYFTLHEVKNLAENLATEIVKAKTEQSLIGILVDGGVALPLCMLASFLTDSAFTVLDSTSKTKTLVYKISSVPISLLLLDSCNLPTLENLLLTLKQANPITCIIVDPYPFPTFPTFTIQARNQPSHVLDRTFVQDTAFLVFTSGSTGEPKPTPVLKKSLINFLRWFIPHSVQSEPLQWIQFSGHSFDLLVAEVLTQFISGGTLVLINHKMKLDMSYTLSLMKQYSIQALFLVPTVLSMMLSIDKFASHNLPHLEQVLTTGEKLNLAVVSRFFQRFPPGKNEVLLHNWGGPSECCIGIAHCIINEECSLSVVPYGYPVNNCEVQVVSLTSRQPVPMEHPGEILISGTPVFNGYANPAVSQPFLSKERKRWYPTGDIGYLNSKGQLVFLSRYDKQVKLGGQRIDLDGIKRQILNLGLVYILDVILDVMELRGMKRMLCFPLVTNITYNEEKVQRDLSSLLPSKIVPLVVQCMVEYPLLDSQKVNLKKLKEIARQDLTAIDRQDSVASTYRGVTDELIKAVHTLHPMLRVMDPGLSLDALGFDSLMKAQLYQMLVDMGYDISLSLILASRSLQDLSDRMSLHVDTVLQQPFIFPSIPTGDETDTAIIGMHIEVAGASSCDEFWDVILCKKETISHNLPMDPLLSAEAKRSTAQYVGSRGLLSHRKLFDASLFSIPPSEAMYLDPQQRLLLQGVWTALEQAGYDSLKFSTLGKIGVFAGAEFPSYMFNIMNSRVNETREEIVWHTLRDNVALRIGRAFDFRGPCITVANNCSTFLVALHCANQSLLSHECDIAVVAAATVSGQESGYLTTERDIYSKDGHCCPFSSSASGTVMSDGLTIIVLRRLSDALQNGDDVICLVKGTGVGSDGSLSEDRQLQPSSTGQLQVLLHVLRKSNIESSSIGLVEAHGTGTKVGDQIELESLNKLFKMDSKNEGRKCPLGSVKGNIGHAGVAAAGPGVVKAALALQCSKLPPSINCENPIKSLESSHFYVNTDMKDWNSRGPYRRALVHSVGAMGSNAAIILEEFNSHPMVVSSTRVGHAEPGYPVPVCISANSSYSLQKYCRQLKDTLIQTPSTDLIDVAFTLLHSRRLLALRISHTCSTMSELHSWLSSVCTELPELVPHYTSNKMCCVMFSGQGSLINPAMFSVLSSCLPGFKDKVSKHFDFLSSKFTREVGLVNLTSLLAGEPISDKVEQCLKRPPVQHTLFVAAQIGTCQSLSELGMQADCFIGHSLGEYTAACLAGALTVEEVLEIVFKRGILLEKHAPNGRMLSVRAQSEKVKQFCLKFDNLEVSCLNSPQYCVVSGPPESVHLLSTALSRDGVQCYQLPLEYGFHHSCMQPVQEHYEKALHAIEVRPLEKTLITCSKGNTTLHEVGSTIPHTYWVDQLVIPCDFMSASKLLMSTDLDCVEIGLKPTLVHFLANASANLASRCIPVSMNPPSNPSGLPMTYFVHNLTNLWTAGKASLLHKLQFFAPAKRIKIPTYPFDLQEYWIDPFPLKETATFEQEESGTQLTTVEAILGIISAFSGPHNQDRLPSDSLTLVSLGNRLYDLFGIDVSDLITQDRTPVDIANYIVAKFERAKPSAYKPVELKLLTPPNEEVCRTAFIINAIGGNKLHSFTPLAHALASCLKVYGLHAPTSIFNLKTIDEYADLYLNELRRVQTTGPFIIGGFSFGAWVAHSIVRKLEARGEIVQLLFMVDPPNMVSEGESFPHHVYSLISLGLESVRSFTYNPVKETITRFSSRFLAEANLLQQYQLFPKAVSSQSMIFIAKDRLVYDTSFSLEYWFQWCAKSSTKVDMIPGQHSTCISSLNCQHIAEPLLNFIVPDTGLSCHRVPVCSPYEVAGEWKLEKVHFRVHDGSLSESQDFHQLSLSGLLRLSTAKQYTCIIPTLQHVVSSSIQQKS